MVLANPRLTESRKGIYIWLLIFVTSYMVISNHCSCIGFSSYTIYTKYYHGSVWVGTFTAAHPSGVLTVVPVAAVGPKMNHDTTLKLTQKVAGTPPHLKLRSCLSRAG